MGSDSPTRGIYCCSVWSCNLTIDGEMIPMDDELAMRLVEVPGAHLAAQTLVSMFSPPHSQGDGYRDTL